MRKRKNEIDRVRALLSSDRGGVSDNFSLLLKRDLMRFLLDFFDGVEGLEIESASEGDKVYTKITFLSKEIKKFIYIPDANLL